jgi:hypothetical protein
MGNDAIALVEELEQLRIPVVGAQRPAVKKDFSAVLRGDHAHFLSSSASVRRRKGWLFGFYCIAA